MATSIDIDSSVHFRSAKVRFSTNFPENKNKISNFIDDISVYNHQVAGHTKEVIKSMNGLILKPMMKKDLFLREVALYEDFFDASHDSTSDEHQNTHHFPHATPVAFIPAYFGVVMTPSENFGIIPYLALSDAAHGFKKPCVMDIKMGQQTYEPTASIEKVTREITKYPAQKDIGFRITGFKLYDILSEKYLSFGKKLGRSLLSEQLLATFAAFFYNGMFYRREVILCVIEQLQRLTRWMKRQTRYHFYCSSLLVVYEGNALRDETPVIFDAYMRQLAQQNSELSCDPSHTKDIPHFLHRLTVTPNTSDSRNETDTQTVFSIVGNDAENSTSDSQATKSNTEIYSIYEDFISNHPSLWNPLASKVSDLVQVKMIDFAHTIRTDSPLMGDKKGGEFTEIDSGYVHGLETLVTVLEDVVNKIDSDCSLLTAAMGSLFGSTSIANCAVIP